LPFYGFVILCIDDPIIEGILPEISRPTLTYGMSESADIRAFAIDQVQSKINFTVSGKCFKQDMKITLNMAGKHNVLNALAAIAVVSELGIDSSAIQNGLTNFLGIRRRFQLYGEINTKSGPVLMIDDYGHHPREVEATINAIRDGWPQRRLVLAFQPHRYTRTRDLFEDFTLVLSKVDVLLITEIYSAGEAPISAANGRALCRAIRTRGQVDPIFVDSIDNISDALLGLLQEDDILLTSGAGSIGSLAAKLPNLLAEPVR